MPRRYVSPLQSNILKVLEEAGEENIATVLNTLYLGRTAPNQDELATFERSLIDLWKKGFVVLEKEITKPRSTSYPVPQSDRAEVFPLANIIGWSAERAGWTNRPEQTYLLVITKQGEKHLRH